ncbi:MAG: hypothetical protein WCV79_00195 [Candidatus Paceibacterota bacterium]
METLIHADIFFVIASVGVVIVIIAGSIASYYIVKILKNVRHITDTARNETDKLSEELGSFRKNVSENKFKIGAIFGLIYHLVKRYNK